jgi:hypothetical protein
MKIEAHKRLEDSQNISVPVAAITGLWRRGILRMPGTHDRRRYVRIPTDDMAQVSVVGAAASEPMEARVVDVSRGGMRLNIKQLLAAGTMLRVQLRDTGVLAEVRYSVASDGAFTTGVQVQSVL